MTRTSARITPSVLTLALALGLTACSPAATDEPVVTPSNTDTSTLTP